MKIHIQSTVTGFTFVHALFILIFFTPLTARAQTASISGKVIDKGLGMGLPGASVIIDGTTTGTTTDMDGNFKISQVTPGKIVLKVSYVGYVTETFGPFELATAEEKKISFTLSENVNQLQETQVVARKTTNTENAVLMDVKKSEQIVNGVSSQQISKSQDRTAAEVIRRVPGVTMMENGFVNIRGLNERYNLTMLNGILAPSMEADKKAFTLDLIPGSMLDRLMVYKTGAPELPGEFAGGIIKITTKNVSDEDQVTVGYSTAFRMNTTFNDFYQAPKGSTDWLGTDDGTRALPESFPETLYDVQSGDELTKLGRELPNAWTAAKIKAIPDQRFNATVMKNIKFGKVKAANVTSLQYGLTYETYEAENRNYDSYDPEKQTVDTSYDYSDVLSKENVRLSLIHNWSFLVSPKSSIDFRNFFSQLGSNQAVIRNGANYDEESFVKAYAFRYLQRTIYSGQLSGTHDIFAGRTQLDWTGGYSYAHTAEPDFRRIRTKKNFDAPANEPYHAIMSSSASTLDAGRFYSDMNEHIGTVAINLTHALKPQSETLIPKFRMGIYTEGKQREFESRWMSYKQSVYFDPALVYLPLDQIFAPENIDDSTGFKLEEGTNPNDSYDGSNLLFAGYAGVTWPFSTKITVSAGVRTEYNQQTLTSRTYGDRPVEVDNVIVSVLPSVNASYNFTPKSLIRVAYARTVNRPEFRELAPFSYYDFTFNHVLTGNSDLLTPSIDNFDVRWEFYPSVNDVFSIGAFYKHFTNPIEMFFEPGSTLNFTYGNAPSAMTTGIELEIRKSFNSLFDTTGKVQGAFVRKFLCRTGITFNTAIIDSKVELGDEAVGQSETRAMMGQSPFIVNTGLFYSNLEQKFTVNVFYNLIGRRIYAVGTYGNPDIYYMPRNSLDVTVTKGFGKYLEVKAGVQDLIAQDEVYVQDWNENGKIDNTDPDVFRIRRGAYYTLGIGVKF